MPHVCKKKPWNDKIRLQALMGGANMIPGSSKCFFFRWGDGTLQGFFAGRFKDFFCDFVILTFYPKFGEMI